MDFLNSIIGGLTGGDGISGGGGFSPFTPGITSNQGIPGMGGGAGAGGIFESLLGGILGGGGGFSNPAQQLGGGLLGSLLGGSGGGGDIAQASGNIDSSFTPYAAPQRQQFFDPLQGQTDALNVGNSGPLEFPDGSQRIDAGRQQQVGAFRDFQQGRGFFEGGAGQFQAPQGGGNPYGQSPQPQQQPQAAAFGGGLGDSLASSPQGTIMQMILQSLLTNGGPFNGGYR